MSSHGTYAMHVTWLLAQEVGDEWPYIIWLCSDTGVNGFLADSKIQANMEIMRFFERVLGVLFLLS